MREMSVREANQNFSQHLRRARAGLGKGSRAIDLVLRSARDGVIPLQVLGEYPSEKTNLSALMTSGD